ncbi:MAG: hypothetical protein P1V20_28690 [Verrucomicrobiales bacterium]|nr:hypothetical protein [Verrucomicrobiales bacterium]
MSETHNYIRHIVSTVATWYSIAAAGNIAVLGWLGSSNTIRENPLVVIWLAVVFLLQNTLGIVLMIHLRVYLENARTELLKQSSLNDLEFDNLFPVRSYRGALKLVQISIFSLILTWVAAPVAIYLAG